MPAIDLSTWRDWRRGRPLPPGFSHWTAEGVFEIAPELLSGCLVAVIRFRGRFVAALCRADTAGRELAGGRFDDQLGVARFNRPPRNLKAWNGLR